MTLHAEFACEPGVLQTREGEVAYEAGDALMTGVEGERWPIPADVFPTLYRPTEGVEAGCPGAYVRIPDELVAVQVTEPVVIALQDGRGSLRAEPGDWLLQGADGQKRVVSDAALGETYHILDDKGER